MALSNRSPSARDVSNAALTQALAIATTGCDEAAIFSPVKTASSSSSAAGTTRDTSPRAQASCAEI